MGVKRSCAQHSYRSDFGLRVAISKNEINDIFPFFLVWKLDKLELYILSFYISHILQQVTVPMETRKSESVQSQK